jgi:hypothetical protein
VWLFLFSHDIIKTTIIAGVLIFFVLLRFFGLILHCSSFNSNDPCTAGCHNCCYGWGILDCFPASMEACFALVVIFVIVFAILGIAYGFLAATMAIQRIWQTLPHPHKEGANKGNELIFYAALPLFLFICLLDVTRCSCMYAHFDFYNHTQ